MKKLKKLLSLAISTALLITTIPINSFSVSYPVLPQYEFSNFAKITSANFYGSDTTVINIQDLHNNKEVQDNIYKLLDSLNKKYGNLEVYIEGASQSIDYSKLSKEMSESELAALMNSLYENDKISGAEFFGYKNNKILKPTEQKQIYDKNIQNYSFLIKNKEQINDLLFERYIKIKALDKYLNPDQRKLLKYYNAYLNKKISSEKFYNKVFAELNIRKISPLRYINTKLYFDVISASKYVNQKAAERQLQTVLSNLKNTITYQAYVDLLKDSNNLTDINVIFAFLSANISQQDKTTKYPDLFNLISLKELSSLINPLDLIDEERQMVEDILLSYSKYSDNKEIIFLNLFFQVYKKLLSAAISSNEYEYYKKNYSRFSVIYSKYLENDLFELYGYARVAEQFNELNLQRNLSFIKNLSSNIMVDKNYNSAFKGKLYNIDKILSSLDKTKQVKVIISGGFHTEGFNELLDENKISYLTLTPNVKENDSLYEQRYFDSIVEQADVEVNAIAKRPFLEQQAPVIIANIVESLNSILKNLKDGKSLEEIQKIVNGVIRANSLQDFVSFDINDEGVAAITVDGKTYTLNYENGKVSVRTNFTTTLAKNIKALIREALKVGSIRSILGLKPKYDGTAGSKFNQEAEYFFMRHNILFPGFADICLQAIVGDLDPDVSDRSQDKVYQALLKAKNSFIGNEFNCDITIGRSSALVGARPDGYGNIEEYGSLFYVVWEQNADGVYVAKNILVSNILLNALQNLNEQELKKFFTSLFVHERLEMIAVTGGSEKFNQYVLDHKLSRTTEVFHQYIQSSDFYSFLAEQGMSPENIDEQKAWLEEMDIIISDVNRANSQYSNIISVSSLQENKTNYRDDVLDAFLAVRAGDKKAIDDYNSKLLNKIVSQIEKEYILSKRLINPDFDIEKDLNIEDFIDFINKFVVVYRSSNNYTSSNELAVAIKKALVNKFKISNDKSKTIFIPNVELGENEQGEIVLKDNKGIKGKKVLFIEDIISKQSETFNDIYNLLMDNGADKVQGAVFFDLSKEPENSNLITDSVYKRIIETQNKSKLLDVITSVDGNISKYLAYWLVKLSKDSNGQKILKQINSLDSKTVNNLMNSLMNMVKDNKLARGVNCYEVINLILFLGFGEQKDINSITRQEMDEFLQKYDFRVKDKKGELALEVNYDDWKESIPSLILYSYMLGYDYIDALRINNLVKKHGRNKIANKRLIDEFCKEFNISFTDKKTKLKHTYEIDISEELAKKIEDQKDKLEAARTAFKEKASQIEQEYQRTQDYDKYLEEIEKVSAEYREIVKSIMIDAKQIVIDKLAAEKMKIDDSLFAIIIGGSLVKGNMMAESDIYYDIIVPDGTISKSIDKHFAPLYSSILQKIGLTNYYVLKYSTTNMTRRNINTFVDERDIAPFLNYSPLSPEDSKKNLFVEYRRKLIEDIKNKNTKSKIQQSLALITKKYFNISQKGKSWLGNSFHIAYDGNKSFSTRWTIMAFESKLNEIIFKYILESGDENVIVPVSVKEQIKFIREHNLVDKSKIDKLESYWEYLSAERYIKQNNTWTDISDTERQATDEINNFVLGTPVADPMPERIITKIRTSADLLSVIEDFVYDNSTSIGEFRRGYNKYSHLETWKGFTDAKNKDIFIKAQIIDLLVEIDSPELREKLRQLNIPRKDLEFIFESLDAIKLIDEKFPEYSSIQGERSFQNYWDAVAVTAKNPETMFALIAHKLTKAQTSQDKEDQLLLYSVYLPLSRRFGNSEIYEYVRNDSFECSHPAEYLNLLNIINTLYGIPYSKLKEYNGNLKQALAEYFEANGMDMSNIEIKNRVKSLYSIYEKLNSSRRKEDGKEETLSNLDIAAMRFIVNSDDIFNRLMTKEVRMEKFDNMSAKAIKKKILGYIDKGFNELDDKEKEFLFTMFAEMKNAVFADYQLVDYINGNLKKIIETSKGDNGLVDIKTLEDKLKASGNETALELWFVNLFEGGLKDLIGLHVVVKDEEFPDAVRIIETKTGKESYSGVTDFFLKKIKILFSKFDKDKKNKQARLKINAAIKVAEGVPVPVEMCLYERTDYENETYGLYNHKKMSAPHYIYKMGKNFNASLFEHIFAKEMDYSFIDPTDIETKQMVYESDGIIPTGDLAANFREIMKKISGNITCFVEYEDGVYVQKLPEGSTVFDLATSRYFSDDINVAVYRDTGDQITSDVPLDDTQTYKIIKRAGCLISVPASESDIHTTRAKLIYKRLNSQNKADISEFIKSIGTIEDINEVLNLLLKNEEFRKMLDGRDLEPSNIAEKLLNAKPNNKILQNKDSLEDLLSIIFDIILSRDLENMLPSQFIARSNQIANHYNLANMFELFEAVENGIIKFDDIKSFYEMCFVVKTKADINISDIENKISSKYKITKLGSKDLGYNLIINDNKYLVEGLPLINDDTIQAFIDLLNVDNENLRIEHVVAIDDTRVKEEKGTIFISTGFVQPKKEFPLMSLGNNVEALVRHAMIHHQTIVGRILKTTEELAHGYEEVSKDEEGIGSLLDPVLMTQILLGLYSKESYDETKTPLSQQTPYLSQEDVDLLKDEVKSPKLDAGEVSKLKQTLPQIFEGDSLISAGISDVKIVVSRSLDLAEDENIYSFATLFVDKNGVATLYISEALLRELDKLPIAAKQRYLKNLAVHETVEYLALSAKQRYLENLDVYETVEYLASSVNPDIDYNVVHEAFNKLDSQKDLMDFIHRIVPEVLRTKQALYEEVDSILNVAEPFDSEPNNTVAFLLGNRMISSFTDTFNLYRKRIIGKIFISGNRRGTVDIISKIRKENKYMKNIRKTITRLDDVHTVEDLLAMTDEAFEKLLEEDKEFQKTGKASELYIDRINKNRPVSESYIIRWVILEDARQAGMNEQEIAELDSNIILETEAFNTPQNITNLFEHEGFLDYIADRSDINIVLIQTPFSQCRALATLNKYLSEHKGKGPLKGKEFNIQNIDFGVESEYYHYANVYALKMSLGEWARLIAYSLKGDIIPHMKKTDGLQALPMEALKDINALIPLLNDRDKAELVKLYTDAAKQDDNFKSLDALLKVLEQQVGRGNRYNLIASFLTYLYTDTTEERQKEDWNTKEIKAADETKPEDRKQDMQPKDVLPQLDVAEQLSIDKQIKDVHKFLAAA